MHALTRQLILIAALAVLAGCSTDRQSAVVDRNEIEPYLNTTTETAVSETELELAFWTDKLDQSPHQYPYHLKAAQAETRLFDLTGRIEHLKRAESHLLASNEATVYDDATCLRALAHNYVAQHRFPEARELLQKAEINGEHLSATHKMLFDVYMEVGDYEAAEQYLGLIEEAGDFDYLIRKAKWKDHKGDLGLAILYMEQALEIAQDRQDEALVQWAQTNLGDFYGHAGRIDDSYAQYLAALQREPYDAYAKKGISWIAYSNDRNPELARRILTSVNQYYEAPDYHLILAEFAEYEADNELRDAHIREYFRAVENKGYGVMYNAQDAKLLAEDPEGIDDAVELAVLEVDLRPTPMSYSLLAWTHLQHGENERALQIIETHVKGRSEEPELLYHMAAVYKANNLEPESKRLKASLLEAEYEMGPVAIQDIRKL